LFVASFNTGRVYRLDPITGKGSILVPGQTGRAGVGIKFDARTNLLFVAGGATGHAFVYDASTGPTWRTSRWPPAGAASSMTC
jgi:hypothetical protein